MLFSKFARIPVLIIKIGMSLSLVQPMPVMAYEDKNGMHLITAVTGQVMIQGIDQKNEKIAYEGHQLQKTDKLKLNKSSSARILCHNTIVLDLNIPEIVSVEERCKDKRTKGNSDQRTTTPPQSGKNPPDRIPTALQPARRFPKMPACLATLSCKAPTLKRPSSK
jgi:hypothetical protein